MPLERTLCIIKPDAVEKRKAGAVLALLEERGFTIVALERLQLTKAVAEGFYAVHKARPFFGELVQLGATDPAKAEGGTIRKLYGSNVGENAVHGSDSLENAKTEIAYFFGASRVAPSV
jgi:nucleoside-diphosphate kinase